MIYVALDRNPGPRYDTLLLRMIPEDLLSAFPHRQFHTLPGFLDSWAAYNIPSYKDTYTYLHTISQTCYLHAPNIYMTESVNCCSM